MTPPVLVDDKAAVAARGSGLPAPRLDLIEQAPKYAGGRGVRIEMRHRRDVAVVERVAALKMANQASARFLQ